MLLWCGLAFLVLAIIKLLGAKFSWWWVWLPVLLPALVVFIGLLAVVGLSQI